MAGLTLTSGAPVDTPRAAAARHFIAAAGWGTARRSRIAGDASARAYDRLTADNGRTAILMDAPPDRGEDTRPFTAMAAHLRDQGLSAPDIYAEDAARGFLLIEDLGDALFARLMAADPARQTPLYGAAVDVLTHLHAAPLPAGHDLAVCDGGWLTDMTAPLFEWYVSGGETYVPQDFAAAFAPLAASLDDAPRVVVLRDYHAENLLFLPDRSGVAQVGLLDFQDAVLGHPAYDLVSIVQDARRNVPLEIEAAMIDRYLARSGQPEAPFRAAYALLGAQRNLRILGIFARLCLRDGKPGYVDLIPRVWTYVQRNLAAPALAPVAEVLAPRLPEPTPDFLQKLRDRCPASH